MTRTVGTLLKELEDNRETVREVSLRDIKLDGEGLKVTGFENPVQFDTVTEGMVGRFLGINETYLKKCPPDLKESNVNYWLDAKSASSATFHMVGDRIEGIHDTDFKFIPMRPTMERVIKVFDPEDEVVRSRTDRGNLHLDLLSQANKIEVPGLGTDHRPMDDITHGGIRFFMYRDNEAPPRLQTYLHRLVCSNGLAMDEPEFTVHLRGNTVPEILDELERAAGQLLGNMGERLDAYRKSAEVPIEGDLAMFIHQYAAEHEISPKVTARVLDNLPVIGDNPTAYDVTQIFTGLANDENLRYGTQIRLQEAGGGLALHAVETLHRCSHCQKKI